MPSTLDHKVKMVIKGVVVTISVDCMTVIMEKDGYTLEVEHGKKGMKYGSSLLMSVSLPT